MRAGGARLRLAAVLRFLACRRGAAALQFALVAPLLLTLILGLVEFGRTAWITHALRYGVQSAARCAAVRPDLCGSPEQIAAYAGERLAAWGVTADAFSVNSEACGLRIQAGVDHRILGYGADTPYRLTASYCRDVS